MAFNRNSSVLNVVIDERRQLENLEPADFNRAALMKQALRFATLDAYSSKQNIYKDYLLSSDVFYLD